MRRGAYLGQGLLAAERVERAGDELLLGSSGNAPVQVGGGRAVLAFLVMGDDRAELGGDATRVLTGCSEWLRLLGLVEGAAASVAGLGSRGP